MHCPPHGDTSSPDGDHPVGKVYVGPRQAADLGTAHSRGGDRLEQRRQPVAGRVIEESAGLPRSPYHHRAGPQRLVAPYLASSADRWKVPKGQNPAHAPAVLVRVTQCVIAPLTDAGPCPDRCNGSGYPVQDGSKRILTGGDTAYLLRRKCLRSEERRVGKECR